MCSEAFNLIDTFLQMCFPGIKTILAHFDSIFILCCAEGPFVGDVGYVTVCSVRRSVRWHRAACATALGGVALAGSGGGMSS